MVAVLAASTWLLTQAPARYRVIDPAPLPNVDFSSGLRHWSRMGGGVTLDSDPSARLELVVGPNQRLAGVSRSLPIAGGTDHLRVDVTLRARAEALDTAPWQGAFVTVMSFDRSGRRLWYWPAAVARVRGDTDSRRYTRTIPISEDAARMWLFVYVSAPGGRLAIESFAVEAVEERPAFIAARWVIAGLWLLAGVWTAARLVRPPSVGRLAVVSLAGLYLVLGVVPQPQLRDRLEIGATAAHLASDRILAEARRLVRSPDEARNDIGEPVPGSTGNVAGEPDAATARPDQRSDRSRDQAATERRDAPAMKAPAGERVPGSIAVTRTDDKLAHRIAFFVLSLLAVLVFHRAPPWRVVMSVPALAAVVQTIQALTITREPDWADLRADGGGIAGGLALGFLVVHLVRRHARLHASGNRRPPRSDG